MTPRTEQELRDALALAAADHPNTADVRPTRRRRPVLLPLAAAAVVLLAVGIPTYLLRSQHSDTTRSVLKAGSDPAAGVSTGVAHGPVNDPATVSNPIAIGSYPSAGHSCRPDEVKVSLAWAMPVKVLTGTLTVKNTSTGPCDLLTKPSVTARGPDGEPVPNAMTAEGRIGPQILEPGASTKSTITWTGWCGTNTSAPVVLEWGTGKITVTPTGSSAAISSCAAGQDSANISASWFDPLS
jgi:hypothetical protein